MTWHSQRTHLICFTVPENVHLLPCSLQNQRVTNDSIWKGPQVSNLTSCSTQTQIWDQTRLFRLFYLIWSWKLPRMEPAHTPLQSASLDCPQSEKCSLTSSQPETALFQFMTISSFLLLCTSFIKCLAPSSWWPPLRYWKAVINSLKLSAL